MKKKTLASLTLLVMLMLLMMSLPVMAQGNESDISGNETDFVPVNGENADFTEDLEVLGSTLIAFVLASILWALTGFFKIRDPKSEGFDPVQFFTTLIVGAVTGLIAFVIYEVKGVSLTPVEIWQYLLAAGFVAFVESWIKVVWRRLAPYFAPPAK